MTKKEKVLTKLTVLSSALSVIVLKAIGMMPIRIFPGYNYVTAEGFDKYFMTGKKENTAAIAQRDQFLKLIGGDLDREQAEQAAKSSQKNKDLNKANRIIKANAKTISASDDKIKAQDEQLKKQAEEIKAQAKQIESQDLKVSELMEKMDKLLDATTVPTAEKEKGK